MTAIIYFVFEIRFFTGNYLTIGFLNFCSCRFGYRLVILLFGFVNYCGDKVLYNKYQSDIVAPAKQKPKSKHDDAYFNNALEGEN